MPSNAAIPDWLNPLQGVLNAAGGVIDKFIDDPEEVARAQALLQEAEAKLLREIAAVEQVRAETVQAEVQGQSWLQRNWRPITALCFVFIVVNNFILVPYANAFGLSIPVLDLPPGLWALLTTMISGYTLGRSWEKRFGRAGHKEA